MHISYFDVSVRACVRVYVRTRLFSQLFMDSYSVLIVTGTRPIRMFVTGLSLFTLHQNSYIICPSQKVQSCATKNGMENFLKFLPEYFFC